MMVCTHRPPCRVRGLWSREFSARPLDTRRSSAPDCSAGLHSYSCQIVPIRSQSATTAGNQRVAFIGRFRRTRQRRAPLRESAPRLEMTNHHARSLSDLKNRSENLAGRGQFLPVSQGNS